MENVYNKEQEKLYVNVTVFDFDRYTSDEQFDDNKTSHENDLEEMTEVDEPFVD